MRTNLNLLWRKLNISTRAQNKIFLFFFRHKVIVFSSCYQIFLFSRWIPNIIWCFITNLNLTCHIKLLQVLILGWNIYQCFLVYWIFFNISCFSSVINFSNSKFQGSRNELSMLVIVIVIQILTLLLCPSYSFINFLLLVDHHLNELPLHFLAFNILLKKLFFFYFCIFYFLKNFVGDVEFYTRRLWRYFVCLEKIIFKWLLWRNVMSRFNCTAGSTFVDICLWAITRFILDIWQQRMLLKAILFHRTQLPWR